VIFAPLRLEVNPAERDSYRVIGTLCVQRESFSSSGSLGNAVVLEYGDGFAQVAGLVRAAAKGAPALELGVGAFAGSAEAGVGAVACFWEAGLPRLLTLLYGIRVARLGRAAWRVRVISRE
jgi:hypothetical protein